MMRGGVPLFVCVPKCPDEARAPHHLSDVAQHDGKGNAGRPGRSTPDDDVRGGAVADSA